MVDPSVKLTCTADEIARNLVFISDEITGTVAKVSAQEIWDLKVQIHNAGRVFVAGAGRSGLVLRMAAMRLMHLGLSVYVVGDTTTPAISSSDVLLVASGSGTTSGVVKSATTASKVGAGVVAFTTDSGSPLAALADVVVIIPAAQKTDHGSNVSQQYAGSLFEQVLFLSTEALFQSLWDNLAAPAEELWERHANLE